MTKDKAWQVRLSSDDWQIFRQLSDKENRSMARIFRAMLHERARQRNILPKEK